MSQPQMHLGRFSMLLTASTVNPAGISTLSIEFLTSITKRSVTNAYPSDNL